MVRLLVGLYVALVLALLAGVVGIWRIRCESFGCMGIGVAWFAWVVSFAVVLGVGALARVRSRGTGLARVCRTAWWLQLLTGIALLLAWAVRQLA